MARDLGGHDTRSYEFVIPWDDTNGLCYIGESLGSTLRLEMGRVGDMGRLGLLGAG